ncbi:MAG: tRNA (adenosine(37)-N6)-dimethylallyltransferase MiaA [Bacteroidales bacterium]|nr:tRNA (adenosine(37)-N6)-dimethylallyltransferase MiaA [Bacteroidales bacterium]
MANPYNLIVITGPTATGKTSVAANLALQLGGEIISADSRQVYRGMTLGTGKDLAEYTIGDKKIPYHLIDIADAGYQYNVYEYQRDFLKAFDQIQKRKNTPILCGGSGLYLQAAIEGYRLISVPPDPALRATLEQQSDQTLIDHLASFKTLHNHTDTDTRKRLIRAIEIEEYYTAHQVTDKEYPPIHPLLIGINLDLQLRRDRITQRLQQRLDQGMIGEVKTLLDQGLTPEQIEYYGLEYKFIVRHLTGQLDYQQMFQGLNTAIHQFAKRQMTWFRRMEKNGHHIHWIDATLPMDHKIQQILTLFRMENN